MIIQAVNLKFYTFNDFLLSYIISLSTTSSSSIDDDSTHDENDSSTTYNVKKKKMKEYGMSSIKDCSCKYSFIVPFLIVVVGSVKLIHEYYILPKNYAVFDIGSVLPHGTCYVVGKGIVTTYTNQKYFVPDAKLFIEDENVVIMATNKDIKDLGCMICADGTIPQRNTSVTLTSSSSQSNNSQQTTFDDDNKYYYICNNKIFDNNDNFDNFDIMDYKLNTHIANQGTYCSSSSNADMNMDHGLVGYGNNFCYFN